MSELPKPSPSAAVTVNYAPEFCVDSERLPLARKTVGCFVVTVFQVADNKGNTIHVKRGRNYYGKMRHSRHPQACRRLTLYKPPSCDGYLPIDLTVRSTWDAAFGPTGGACIRLPGGMTCLMRRATASQQPCFLCIVLRRAKIGLSTARPASRTTLLMGGVFPASRQRLH